MKCERCNEPIQEGEDFLAMPVFGSDQVVMLHVECEALGIVGHEMGVCSCTNYLGLSQREAAREVRRRLARNE